MTLQLVLKLNYLLIMENNMKILLIDDREEKRTEVYNALKELDSNIDILCINQENVSEYIPNDNSKSNKDTQAPEDLLAEKLESKQIDLIIVDHDLTQLQSKISEPVVSIASHAASIPLCRYARVQRKSNMSKLSDAVEAGTTFSIKIDIENLPNAAKEIIDIAQGFKYLKEQIHVLESQIIDKGPAYILSTILGDLSQEDYLSQYSISANILGDILELYSAEQNEDFDKSEIENIKKDRLAYIIGYWLYNSILKFPGVILNKKATYSYLNINENDFEEHSHFFKDAQYKGPFTIFQNYWWKNKLNFILDEADAWTGKSLVEKEIGQKIDSCKCIYEPTLDAGYYCVIKKEPVSKEESLGMVSWLPKGASLCRVGKEPYEQLSPLLGL